ncbi:MAG: hypothetical protein ABSG48_07915 [Geobacteraceae bacterium]|jgi:hypothetical protein
MDRVNIIPLPGGKKRQIELCRGDILRFYHLAGCEEDLPGLLGDRVVLCSEPGADKRGEDGSNAASSHASLEKTNLRKVIMSDGTILFIEVAAAKK